MTDYFDLENYNSDEDLEDYKPSSKKKTKRKLKPKKSGYDFNEFSDDDPIKKPGQYKKIDSYRRPSVKQRVSMKKTKVKRSKSNGRRKDDAGVSSRRTFSLQSFNGEHLDGGQGRYTGITPSQAASKILFL
jgi:hypothetical protein